MWPPFLRRAAGALGEEPQSTVSQAGDQPQANGVLHVSWDGAPALSAQLVYYPTAGKTMPTIRTVGAVRKAPCSELAKGNVPEIHDGLGIAQGFGDGVTLR